MSSSRLDPDELALLEEERDHLLSSLEDLEREHDAGDLADDDYRTLRDDYTVRASEVLQAIEDRRRLVTATRAPRGRGRTVVTVVAVVGLAAVAGVVVAQNSGQRGGGVISGAVDTQRARLATCQQASFQEPRDGVECYDEILADAPDNVEALTYRGWALIRLDRVEEGAADLERAVEIDPDYADARVFRAVVAKRGGDYDLAAAEIDRFYRNGPSPAAIQVLQMQGLEREIFIFTVGESDPRLLAAGGQGPGPRRCGRGSVPAPARCVPRRGPGCGPHRRRRTGVARLHERGRQLDRPDTRGRAGRASGGRRPRGRQRAPAEGVARLRAGTHGRRRGRPGRAGHPAAADRRVPVRRTRGASEAARLGSHDARSTPSTTSVPDGSTTTSVDRRIQNPGGG